MLNCIKMDLFRLLKSKSLYITLIIYTIILWYSVNIMFSGNLEIEKVRDSWDAYRDFKMQLINPIYIVNEKVFKELLDIVSGVLAGILIIFFTGVYTVLFISSEKNSQFIKNIASCVKKRRYIIVSKIAVMSVFFIMEVIVLIIVLVVSSFMGIRNIACRLTLEQLRYMGLIFLLYTAFSTSIILLAYAIKNAAISMMINIFICFQVGTNIMFIILAYLSMLLHTDFFVKIANYSVLANINTLTVNAPFEICCRAMIVAAAAIFIYGRFSITVLERRDI